MNYWKKLKNAKARHDAALAKGLSDMLSRIGNKLRAHQHIDKLNNWCDSHPKSTFAMTIIFCVFGAILSGVPLLTPQKNETQIASLHDIVDISGVVDAVRSNNEGKEQLRNGILEIMKIGSNAINDIDSIMALPSLTHDDSIRLWVAIQQLQIINNTFDETQD